MEEKINIACENGKIFSIDPNDKLAVKFAMLLEGQCTIGVKEAIEKYGYSEQRYYQLYKLFKQDEINKQTFNQRTVFLQINFKGSQIIFNLAFI